MKKTTRKPVGSSKKQTASKKASVKAVSTKKSTTKTVAKASKASSSKLTAAKKPMPVKPVAPAKPVVKKATAPANAKPAVTAATKTVPAPAKPAAKKPAVKKIVAPASAKSTVAAGLKVLFVASECWPFAGTGGLGEVMGSLPYALNSLGHDARVILPLYSSFSQKHKDKLKFVTKTTVPVAWREQYCGLFKLEENGVTHYFIDNEYYFKRQGLYGHHDEAERFAFFSRAVLVLLPHLDFKPDIINCNDWQTALVPIYYKLLYQNLPEYKNIKTVYTIHNIEYQGKFDVTIIEDVLGITRHELPSLEWGGCINLMKAAMDYSDYISTVSETYALELQDDFYSHGLSDIVKKNAHKMRGILNGINIAVWNPQSDPYLFFEYSISTIQKKALNKAELQKMLSLPERPSVPLIAIISRLVDHKGLSLFREIINDLLKKDVQIVVLGTGEKEYENFFEFLTDIYKDKFHAVIDFNQDLSHKIYASADMFLMPSKQEPCGLSQMIAARYGTIPIVRATGGLKDSIIDAGEDADKGIGFVFEHFTHHELFDTIERAMAVYRDDTTKWAGLVKRAMLKDFSWENQAKKYEKMYKEILGIK